MKWVFVFPCVLSFLTLSACDQHPTSRFVGSAALPADIGSQAAAETGRRHLTKFDGRIIDEHEQRFGMSCIPSSVEMVLKLLGRVPDSYYDQQMTWKNKRNGSFRNYDGKIVEGMTFHLQFMLPRNSDFPIGELFDTIHRELVASRFVIIGLASGGGWHSWVIYDEDMNGEFLAVSKYGAKTIQERHVKEVIRRMKGTDIGTYELPSQGL